MTSDEIEKRARTACGCHTCVSGVGQDMDCVVATLREFGLAMWNEAIEAAITEAFDGEDQIAIAALRITEGKP
ncbi:MAG: hypothetical protein VW405_08765 [Rhodospirillaceae bacterium]